MCGRPRKGCMDGVKVALESDGWMDRRAGRPRKVSMDGVNVGLAMDGWMA